MAKPFQLENFLPFRLNVLAQEISQQLSVTYAKRFGMDVPQWRILANLAARGEMTAQEIVRVTLSHKSTISRAVAGLESRNLLERIADTQDKRAYRLRLTTKGKSVFAEILPLVLGFERDVLIQLSAEERRAIQLGLAALERVALPARSRSS